jgi:hypothetical protein
MLHVHGMYKSQVPAENIQNNHTNSEETFINLKDNFEGGWLFMFNTQDKKKNTLQKCVS